VTIYSLSEKGERLAELLHSVASLSYTKEEKDEANECKQRIGNLLEALRESISLWHPANKPSPAAKKMLEAIFSESQ
jgi:non-homologous end joining protein Ku